MAAMETKKKGAVVVTEAAVQVALRRGPARELTSEEERVMRMRLGAALPRKTALERISTDTDDLEIELLSYEIEAYMKWRARQGGAPARPARAAVAQPSRVKEKIVRALRRKV